jgi:hypothetical protein
MGFRPSAISDNFQTRLIFDLFYPDNAVVRLTRLLSEILLLRKDLVDGVISGSDRVLRDRAIKAGEIECVEDGQEDMVTDVHWLIAIIESVERWLSNLLTSIPLDRCKCKALLDFLSPRECDEMLMDVELMANGGMAGAWDISENEEMMATTGEGLTSSGSGQQQ